jgi:hypothetical protein
VAGAGAGDQDLGKVRVPVKKKMFVGVLVYMQATAVRSGPAASGRKRASNAKSGKREHLRRALDRQRGFMFYGRIAFRMRIGRLGIQALFGHQCSNEHWHRTYIVRNTL